MKRFITLSLLTAKPHAATSPPQSPWPRDSSNRLSHSSSTSSNPPSHSTSPSPCDSHSPHRPTKRHNPPTPHHCPASTASHSSENTPKPTTRPSPRPVAPCDRRLLSPMAKLFRLCSIRFALALSRPAGSIRALGSAYVLTALRAYGSAGGLCARALQGTCAHTPAFCFGIAMPHIVFLSIDRAIHV